MVKENSNLSTIFKFQQLQSRLKLRNVSQEQKDLIQVFAFAVDHKVDHRPVLDHVKDQPLQEENEVEAMLMAIPMRSSLSSQ